MENSRSVMLGVFLFFVGSFSRVPTILGSSGGCDGSGDSFRWRIGPGAPNTLPDVCINPFQGSKHKVLGSNIVFFIVKKRFNSRAFTQS